MSDQSKTILETEWSYFIDTDGLEEGTTKLSISPDDDARARLAQRLGLVSLDALTADIEITHHAGEAAYFVKARAEADVTQNCVVTMEPVVNHVSDEFEAWYADPEATISIAKARHEKLTEKGHGEQPILDEKDDPEALVDGKIDLGELVTQYLSLAINPYPHAEGVEFQPVVDKKGGEDDDGMKNPFAALKDWKDKLANGEN